MKIKDINALIENDHFIITARNDYKEFTTGNSTVVKVPVMDLESGEQLTNEKGELRWTQCTVPSQHEIDCFGLLPFVIHYDGASRCDVTHNGVNLYGKAIGYGSIRYSTPMIADLSGVALPDKPKGTRTSDKATKAAALATEAANAAMVAGMKLAGISQKQIDAAVEAANAA